METIKTIDISPLMCKQYKRWSPDQLDCIREIDESLKSIGFMMITGHNINELMLKEMETAVKDFMHQDKDQKQMYAKKSINTANKNVSRGQWPASVFGKEGYDIGDYLFTKDTKIPKHFQNDEYCGYEQNLFPTEQWDKQSSLISSYYDKLQTLSIQLLEVLFRQNNSSIDFIKQIDMRPLNMSTLRQNCYPDCSYVEKSAEDSEELCCETHTDGALLTVLYQDSLGGLQVKNSQGKWINVGYKPNSFVVNTGVGLQILSNGLQKATQHRVKVTEGERISIPFFFEGKQDSILKPYFNIRNTLLQPDMLQGHQIEANQQRFKEQTNGVKIDMYDYKTITNLANKKTIEYHKSKL